MLRKLLIAAALIAITLGTVFFIVTRPDPSRLSQVELTGRVPVISGVRPERVPTVGLPEIVRWQGDARPTTLPRMVVQPFATGLAHPRQALVLPNGDVLVAESDAPRKEASGIKALIAKLLMQRAGSNRGSANRITLLRDANGDGVAEVRGTYITGLNSPYGMVLQGSTLFVADTDKLLAFSYDPQATSLTGNGRVVTQLPAAGSNQHWTKALAEGPDGALYVGVGSNSNIADEGMATEYGRAMVYRIDPRTGARSALATGLRNPSGLALEPQSKRLYAVVNERDMLGSDMVPDYLTRVEQGDFYGWPWYYWGGFLDDRISEPDAEDRSSYVRRPDYALGVHVAPLGISFARSDLANAPHALGAPFDRGAFIALHGSWNRSPVTGGSVVFVAFDDSGRPRDVLPIRVLGGFLDAQGRTQGRPADADIANDGTLLVTDDVGGAVWRVSRAPPPTPLPGRQTSAR